MYMSLLGTELHHVRSAHLVPSMERVLSHTDRSIAERREADDWKRGVDNAGDNDDPPLTPPLGAELHPSWMDFLAAAR